MKRKYIQKILLYYWLTFFFTTSTSGQISFFPKIKNIELSTVLNPDSIMGDDNVKIKRPEPLGFIGSNYQRFEIHISSIEKSKTDPYTYTITGKTRAMNNICHFTGTITIVSATYETSSLMKDIGFPKYKQGLLVSSIKIKERETQYGSGLIEGTMKTDVYFDDKNRIHYNALMLVADGFSNNEFEGKWTSHKTAKVKKCNWGDFRIPDSGDLDIGTGEFSVNEKYVRNGWESYRFAWCCAPDENTTQAAREKEMTKWWK